jgi:hypothetical protein
MRRDKTRAGLVETARLISPLLDFETDPGLVKVSADDTTPDYLDAKIISTDGSVVITPLNDGADEDLDLSVAVYVAAEIATHTSNPNAHHNQSHVLATASGLGADHTVSGLTAGHVLRATGATTAAFGALQATDLAVHVLATTSGLGSQHSVSGLTAGQVLRATGSTTAAFASLQATDLPSHVLATNTALGSQHTISGATAGHVLRASGATTAAFAQLQHSDLGGVGANDHHNQSHVLATTSALGPDHTVSGLTAGQVLKATGATAARFIQLLHSELGSIGANDHHNQSHVLASTSGLGADHTVSGLTARQVLIATGSTTALFRALEDADIPASIARDSEVTSAISTHASDANAHHNRSHAITSSSDHTVTGAALDVVGLTATNTLGILTPSAAVSTAVSALLKTDSNGRLQVQGLGIGTTAAGNALYVNSNINLVGDRSIVAGDVSISMNDTVDIISADVVSLRVRRYSDTRYSLNITPTSTEVTLTSYDNTGAVNRPMVYAASSHTFTGGNINLVGNRSIVEGDNAIGINDTANIIFADTASFRVRRYDANRYRLGINPTSTGVTLSAYDDTGAVALPMAYTASSPRFFRW